MCDMLLQITIFKPMPKALIEMNIVDYVLIFWCAKFTLKLGESTFRKSRDDYRYSLGWHMPAYSSICLLVEMQEKIRRDFRGGFINY